MKIQYIMASAMLAFFGLGSNLYAETSTVKLYVSVLDEDLNYVDGVKKALVVEDVRGTEHAYNSVNQKKEYIFKKGTSATFYVVKPSTGKLGYKKSSDYNKAYLTRATTERDIVLLPKGSKKVSSATSLVAPVVGYVSKTSAEVNAQPFAGVDYKNRKDLSVKYEIVAKNGKKSITKVSSTPKVTFTGLTKGAWSFKYYVRFVDKKGKKIAGTKHYSPSTKAYLGYDYGVVSDASVLAKPEIHIKRTFVEKKRCTMGGCSTYRQAKYDVIAVAPSYPEAIYDNKTADVSYHIDLYKTEAIADYTDDTEGEKVAECEGGRSCIIEGDPYSAYKAVYKLKLTVGKKSVYTKESATAWEKTGFSCIGNRMCPAIDPTLQVAHVAYVSHPKDTKGFLRVKYDGFEQRLYPDYLVRNVKTNTYTLFTNVFSHYKSVSDSIAGVGDGGLVFGKVGNKMVVSYLEEDGLGEKRVQKTFPKGEYEVQARYGSNYSWGGVAEFVIE